MYAHFERACVIEIVFKHREFNWTRAELGVMESSFFYGYLVTQVPAGFLAGKLSEAFIHYLTMIFKQNFLQTSRFHPLL